MRLLPTLALAVLTSPAGAELPRAWDRINFPTAMVFIRISDARCGGTAEARFDCLVQLNALAQAASEGREFIAVTSQFDDSIEPVRDHYRQLSDGQIAVAQYTPSGLDQLTSSIRDNPRELLERRERQVELYRQLSLSNATPIEFERTLSGIMARTRLHPREVAVDTLVRLGRATDPYLHLYSPLVDSRDAKLTLNFFVDGDHLRLSSVYPDSNLDRAGLGLGDRVLTIGDRDFNADTASDVIKNLPPGETLQLTAEKTSGERVEIEVDRREAHAQPVAAFVMEVNRRRLGVVRIQNFTDERVCDLTAQHLKRLAEDGVDGLIYDVRFNPGGRVEQARCVLGLQLGRGKLLWRQRLLTGTPTYRQSRHLFPEMEALFTDRERVSPRVPTVVLINAASASATELAAATLQERGVAWIVGARSFGKGVAQSIFPLVSGFPDVLAWKTIARSEHRDGFSVQGHGVSPDFVVRSELGGSHDANDEQRTRFSEAHGDAFSLSRPTFRRDDARALAYRRVKACVRTLTLRVNDVVRRWLRDHQLRGAAAVALCAK